jgi:hypothetical protein
MGCCSDKSTKEKENIRTETDARISTEPKDIINPKIIDVKPTEKKEDISLLQNKFIEDFMNKTQKEEGEEEKRTGMFIKSEKKKVKISKDTIRVEDEFILTTKIGPTSFFSAYWYFLIAPVEKLKLKKFYIEDNEVNDSDFEIDEQNIQIKFPNELTNEQLLKIKVIQEISLDDSKNYDAFSLYLKQQDSLVKYIIYGVDDILIDDVTNSYFQKNQKLNLIYYEGKVSEDNRGYIGYVYYSKRINYEIYKYLPNFKSKESEIIKKKDSTKEQKRNLLGIYKYVKITDEGQEVEEIFKCKISNYPVGVFVTSFSIGLMLNTEFDVDYVKLNGKNVQYTKGDGQIGIRDFGAYNNQFVEVHLKYKYFTNKEKKVYRQESIITSNIKDTYFKCIIEIPDKYICLYTNEIFMKDPAKHNIYFYDGISNEEQLYEKINISIKKGTWDIEKIITLSAEKNIENCVFTTNKVFKGGNLKEKSYELIKDNAEFEDKDNKYIYTFKNLTTNKVKIGWKVKVENSTSDYKYDRGNELITKIPEEDKQFFKDLANKIVSEDKSNIPNYKKIGKWVHNYITYDLSYKGKEMTAREIYNTKIGVCEHFTLLYNTLLVSFGIDAVKVGGYALSKTEDDDKKMNIKESQIENSKNINTLSNGHHAWSIAKVNGAWIPLDATWDLFDGNVPLSHIFQNYGEDTLLTNYNANNKVFNDITKEVINFIGS